MEGGCSHPLDSRPGLQPLQAAQGIYLALEGRPALFVIHARPNHHLCRPLVHSVSGEAHDRGSRRRDPPPDRGCQRPASGTAATRPNLDRLAWSGGSGGWSGPVARLPAARSAGP